MFSVKLSIVIVSWNTCDLLKKCLESIINFTKDIPYEIIIVDNASQDGSCEMVQSKFPSVILIRNEENVGFSRANNQGIKKAKGEYIALLNSDTYITDNSFFNMIDFMKKDSNIGICGPKILNPDLSPQPTRTDQYKPIDAFLKILGLYNYKRESARMNYNKIQDVEVIGGCCMIFRKSVFDAIGLFDESYFLYNEENDICLRARKTNWKVVFFPTSIVYHVGGASTFQKEISEKVEIACYRSNIYFYKKYFSKQAYFLLQLTYKITFLMRLIELFVFYVVCRPSKRKMVKGKILLKWNLLIM